MSPSVVRLGGLIAVLVLVAWVASAAGRDKGTAKTEYERIEAGMTLVQVEELLGGKGEQRVIEKVPQGTRTVQEWKRGTKAIAVEFLNGIVIGKAEKGIK